MEYADAKKIRGESFGSRMANKLTEGQGIGASLKSTIGEGSKARMTGIKETFDPMNIAKFMTGGSKLGAAVVGKLTGRSQKDMEYFTGKKTSTKTGKLEEGNGMVDMLMKIYSLMQKTSEDNTKMREDERAFKEEKEMERLRRHKELIEAISGGKYAGKASAISNGKNGSFSGGIFDQLNDFVKGKAIDVAEKTLIKATATKVGKDVIKKSAIKTLGKTIGKGALKSIPILGAVIGAGFAIGRLIDGDPVGAGIEAASGLGSVVTSIPLTITNAARDVYKEVYGNFPDPTNPDDQKNLSEIYDICKEVASELLKNSATKAPEPGETQYDEMGNITGYSGLDGIEVTTASSTPTSTSATPASSTPVSTKPTSTTPVSSTPASSTPLASLASATPSPSPNSGQQLNQVQGENLNAKVQETLSEGESVVNNNAISKSLSSTSTKGPLPPVRNQEETFQRMILDSTRVV
jgi:hypothetical protein